MNARLHDADAPSLEIAAELIRQLLRERPVRIAFAGRAGAGKSSLARAISALSWPVINHADTMKEEILEWLTDAMLHGFDPESDEAFLHFAAFMGISPARIQDDLWDLIGPVYASFVRLLLVARREQWHLVSFVGLKAGELLNTKVAFVDQHKRVFRDALQRYGQMSKELAADPEYWVHQTLARSVDHPICFNCDTRFAAEMDCLRNCAWMGVYLWVDDATQMLRRPEMSWEERMHISEWSIGPEDCSLSLDATQPLSHVAMQLADHLSALRRPLTQKGQSR